jgi:type II secretory pathway pseudopilin PulG
VFTRGDARPQALFKLRIGLINIHERQEDVMRDLESQAARGIDRRALLRTGLLTGLGAAAVSVAPSALTAAQAASASASRSAARGAAQAASASVSATGSQVASSAATADATFKTQNYWWWCHQCDGLFWSTSTSDTSNGTYAGGVCPAIAPFPHDSAGSSNYGVPNGNPSQSGVQVGWHWCNKCDVLFWPNGTSYCPDNPKSIGTFGPHTAGGTVYDMLNGSWSGNLQSNWRWCDRCQGLVWGGTTITVCPAPPWPNATSHHSFGNTNYYLFFA